MTALEGGTRQECGRARSGYLRPSSDHGRRVVAEQVLGRRTRDGQELGALRGQVRPEVPAESHQGKGQLGNVGVPSVEPRYQVELPEVGWLLRPAAHRGLFRRPCAHVRLVYRGVTGEKLGTAHDVLRLVLGGEVPLILHVA